VTHGAPTLTIGAHTPAQVAIPPPARECRTGLEARGDGPIAAAAATIITFAVDSHDVEVGPLAAPGTTGASATIHF